MPAKFKKTKTNKRRRNQTRVSRRRSTCKTGGMHRAASVTGRVFNKIIGKGFDRVDKLNQMREAIIKGVTESPLPEQFTPAKLSRTFSASPSPSSPFRMSETPRRSHNAAHDSEFKTPQKGKREDADNEHPHLGPRVRHRETAEERTRRLGLSMAPTMNDATIVVEELFPALP
jgi:hypothetical protein